MGKDRYLIAFTSDTLLLGDLISCKLSEVREVFLLVWFGFYPFKYLAFRLPGPTLEATRSSSSRTKMLKMFLGCYWVKFLSDGLL